MSESLHIFNDAFIAFYFYKDTVGNLSYLHHRTKAVKRNCRTHIWQNIAVIMTTPIYRKKCSKIATLSAIMFPMSQRLKTHLLRVMLFVPVKIHILIAKEMS